MFTVDTNGNITLIQGDSGQIVVNGLPTDKNYKVYMAIQNEKRKPIGNEIMVESENLETVTLPISASLTDLLAVPTSEDSATYYYGIKICYDTDEDTLIIGGGDIGSLNEITVYPKKVEGV